MVAYVAMMDAYGTRIIGSYVSHSPSDIGCFSSNTTNVAHSFSARNKLTSVWSGSTAIDRARRAFS